MNYNIEITEEQTKDLIKEVAKNKPLMLTSALRDAGNFVYLVVPEDILNYDDYQHEGKLKITADEAGETMRVFREKLADCVDYNTILETITDHLLILRKEKERKKNKKKNNS